MSRRPSAPDVSVVIERGSNPSLGQWCLDGFADQTRPSRTFEVLTPRTGEPAIASRTRGLERVTGDVVLFWSTDWRPFPEVIERCLRFHQHHVGDEHAMRLHAVPHITLRTLPFARWQIARDQLVTVPADEGVHTWAAFRCPGLSAPRGLFASGGFKPGFASVADLEAGARLAESVPLKVWYERLPLASARPSGTFDKGWAEAYHDGYFRRLRLLAYPRAQTIDDLGDCFVHPRAHAKTDADTTALLAAIAEVENTLTEAELSYPEPEERERLTLLFDMYDDAIRCARARGWIDAGEGRPVLVPGQKN